MDNQAIPKILIIDDNPANLGVLFDLLISADYDVLIAKNGITGLQRAEYTLPDLILLDIMMPDISGFEVCKQLKTNSQTQNIPIIFMSALSDTVDKVKGLELGAADYITKPFEQAEVLARIRTHLNLRKLQLQLEEQNHTLRHQNRTLEAVIESLQRARQAADNAYTEKNQFIANMTHELLEPMQSILGSSAVLQKQQDIAEHNKNQLAKIHLTGQHLVEFLNDALDFSLIETGKLKLQPSQFAVAKLGQQLQNQLTPLLKQKNNQLLILCPDYVGELYADQHYLVQVFTRLIEYLHHYTQNNEITLNISKEIREDSAWIIFRLQYQSEHSFEISAQHIQQDLQHSEAGAIRNSGVYGLGLAIAQGLIRLQDGQLDFLPGHEEPGTLVRIKLLQSLHISNH